MYAVEFGNLPVMKMLIEHGANVLHKRPVSHTRQLCTLTFAECTMLRTFDAHASCASLLPNDTTHCLVQCRVSLCSHVTLCGSTTCTWYFCTYCQMCCVSTNCHPTNVLCVACVSAQGNAMSANLPPGWPGLLPAGL